MGENQFVGQRQKLLFEIESELAEEVSKTFMRATRSLFPRQGSQNNGASSHVGNAPCLKLGVRKASANEPLTLEAYATPFSISL